MNLNFIISENLKRLRAERNLSLAALSELSGVSKVMIGQIERGESNPTINTIWKLAHGLKVPYTYIIDEHVTDTILVEKDKIICQCSDDKKYRIYPYFPISANRNFELFTAEIDPQSSYYSKGHLEKSYEYVLVFQGEILLEVDNKIYTLKTGSCLQFDSSNPHSYINNSDSLSKMFIINYYKI